MRIDVRKFLFFGHEKEKILFFEEAQKGGLIQFIDPKNIRRREVSEPMETLLRALKILRGLEPMVQEDLKERPEPLVKKIIAIHQDIDASRDREKVLALEIARLSPLGNFSMEEIREIESKTHRFFQFYCAKKKETELPKGLIKIGSDEVLNYFLLLDRQKHRFPKFIEMKVERSAADLKSERDSVIKERHLLESELAALQKYSSFLHRVWIRELNETVLSHAEGSAVSPMGSTFMVEGWVPENKVKEVEVFSDHFGVYVEEVMVEPKEVPPTYLENRKLARIGEDLVSIFDTPSNTDKDPSMWVLLAFMVFFAFIVGDGGYGAVYLGFCLYLRFKWPDLKGVKKRTLNLFTLLCAACVVWGFVTSSFFGLSLDIDNPLRKLSLLDWMVEKKTAYFMHTQGPIYQGWLQKNPEISTLQEPHEIIRAVVSTSSKGHKEYEILTLFSGQILLELALFFGGIHLLLGMARYAPRNWPLFGWMLFTMGGFLYAPLYLEAPSLLNYVFGLDLQKGAEIGLQLMEIGMPLAIVLSLIRNKWLGAFEVMTVIQIFADILSYLRLYALGLAGAIVAGTINELAASLPLVLGVILLLIAHPINMALGVMGGVIHGLRLNFLEWYRYSFEGNGKPFTPLEIHTE